MNNHFDFGWTLENKEKPIGVLFGISTGQWIHIVELNWFQWTTPREKLSSITNFAHKMRKEYILTFTSNEKNKNFYNRMMDYGVLNRIGSMYGVLKERAILYQTKYRQ